MPVRGPNCQLEFKGRKQLAPHLRSCTSRFSFRPPQPQPQPQPPPQPLAAPNRGATVDELPPAPSQEDIDIERLMESLLNAPPEEEGDWGHSAGQTNEDNALPEAVLMQVSETYVGIAEKIIGGPLQLADNPRAEIIEILGSQFGLVD